MPATYPVSNPEEFGPERLGLVRDHLKDVFASKAFAGSKRAQDFLQLIVEHALAGRLDSLRERMIGAEMFGRSIDYDTANDAVVRVKATEVRRKLAQYYQESTKPPLLRIELPSGSYVPKFHWESRAESLPDPEAGLHIGNDPAVATEPAPVATPSDTSRRRWVVAGTLAGLALLAAIAYIGFKVWPRGASPETEHHAIAVLPLQNLSGDPRQDYFADSMTEELIADLGQVSASRVISRTSAMTYKGTTKTLPQIARELGVDTVVEGSVLRQGNQVRITAQLIDAKTDHHLWARSYVRDLNDVLTLQAEVARTIADQIRIAVTPEERARLARPRTVDPEAQELYLQGMQALSTGNPGSAIGYFRKAIDKDPNYAQAYAALANSYGWMGEAGWMPYSEAFPKEKTAAIKAIALDEALPEGHVQLAQAAMDLDWDWATEGREFKRALELNPSSAPVRWAYSNYLERMGRLPEAISELQLALQLDPISSRAYHNTAFGYYYARQYDQALLQMQHASALRHEPAELIFPLAVIYVEKGMYEETIQQFKKLGDQPHALGHMGNAYARMGREAEAREMISQLQKHVQDTGVGRYEIALVYAGLGEKDEAFAWLEKSFAARDKGLTYLKIDPCIDPLRSDSRFKDLVKRVGLPL
jgi:TolB-like protein/thioredoxin-like negative regulator of GroEL